MIFFSCRVFDKKEFFRQNFDRELFSFKSRLGLRFRDENVLLAAFTHESYKDDSVNDDSGDGETVQASENNSKLSLLGKYIVVWPICLTS